MNRLVIIGNGFDLAHGLPTGYSDFIDWYWINALNKLNGQENFKKLHEDNFVSVTININNMCHSSVFDNLKKINSYKSLTSFFQDNMYVGGYENFKYRIDFKSQFFNTICTTQSIQNWVDIENEYYKLLKDCLKEAENYKVKTLNEEFEQVKNLLEDYLENRVNNFFNFKQVNSEIEKIVDVFKIKPQFLSIVPESILREFGNADHGDLIEFDDQVVDLDNQGKLANELKNGTLFQRNLFLNFNYTRTVQKYIEIINGGNCFGDSFEIQIHGQLKNKSNKINFGFGDEMDDGYNLLEKKDDNEYLKNIKSFQYLQNSNYKEMLDFIDSKKFQVYIMGHSCGLSDRILLNTIFEHNNCRSIKVFYHERNGKDNYTDIVQNISRHFNKKKLMRDKIVNKSLCQPLPQGVRFATK